MYKRNNKDNSYDRVMPRVNSRSRNNLKATSVVTRHETSSSVHFGAKPSSSNISSSVYRELPTVLNDYVPEVPLVKAKKSPNKAKPKKTLKSLDPAESPHSRAKHVDLGNNYTNRCVRASAPSLVCPDPVSWSDSHLRQCFSSRSHTKLKELKDEIKEFQEREKLMKIRSHLYKKCGVVLDDVGHVAVDKAVQVQDNTSDIRSERGEDAGAAVSDQQVRPATASYPVDRYLVESSNKIDIVKLIDDGIWNPEPMLSPEDEIILRKLHDMLQSTADDLKLLSGELSKYHEPGVQVKTLPMPLDEEFNEKIHIEEIVNAKFHGYKIVDSTPSTPNIVLKDSNNKAFKANANKTYTKKLVDSSVQVNYMPTLKKPTIRRNLGLSRTKIVQIDEKSKEENKIQDNKNNNACRKQNSPAVVYNEFSYKYVEPKLALPFQRPLQIQDMPSINIRSELTKQKVLQLDIVPDIQEVSKSASLASNALVLTMQHKTASKLQFDKSVPLDRNQPSSATAYNQPTVRKVSKMSTCGSSETSNNVSSDSQQKENQKHYTRMSPKVALGENYKSKSVSKKELKRTGTNLEDWKRKLNAVYGRPKPSTTFKTKKSPKTSHKTPVNQTKLSKNCNNSEYIPYSKLTLGGVSVSDIEREIRNIPNRNEIIISPILDKILSSRENSFHNESPRKKHSPKVLTTSDENLLQEVIDIEYQVTNTLSSKVKDRNKSTEINKNKENKESDSYVDDFEDDQSEEGPQTQSDKSQPVLDIETSYNNLLNEEENIINSDDTHNKTYTKTTNLSFKNAVDIFEFVHSIDTQDTGTQSNLSNKISPKETQTSPRNDQSNIKPIHNDLWPSIDSNKEVERMFNLEKDFIKKLILEEYGDMIDKNFTKASTSKSDLGKNEAASAKNTQTSPAHVKSVMTSPHRTKTRTTSPFSLSVTVNQQTSPMAVVSKQEDFKVEIGDDDDELGISVNLSSPRFSLRLPQSSREVLSNFEVSHHKKDLSKKILLRKSSSSSLNEDYSSSDISSLGEIGKKFKRKLRKNRIPSISELSSSFSPSGCSTSRAAGILPLRSEGEASVGQMTIKKSNKTSRSEGEMSLGQYN